MRTDIWEDLVSLNSRELPEFEPLGSANLYRATDSHGTNWEAEELDIEESLKRDPHPLPATSDREGYYGHHHFSYWASGLRDMRNLLKCADEHKLRVKNYYDFGCASGRAVRHFACQHPEIATFGSDINRRHIEWINKFIPAGVVVFQNHSIPSIPMPDSSIDLISAFSVFTHIEAFETSWLMELRRILKPGGIAWVTVHSEQTWLDMEEDWPLYKGLVNHPEFKKLGDATEMPGERLVFRWHNNRSYSSNVFYSFDYLQRSWGKILEIVDIKRRFPAYQDVVVLRKPY